MSGFSHSENKEMSSTDSGNLLTANLPGFQKTKKIINKSVETKRKSNGIKSAFEKKQKVTSANSQNMSEEKNATKVTLENCTEIGSEISVEDKNENEYKWWLEAQKDEIEKWYTLSHNGVAFPPVYVPHNKKLYYDGSPVDLPPVAEEVATLFAALLETTFAANRTFQENFFYDFLVVLKKNKVNAPIKEFSKCDFTHIHNYLQEEEKRKKLMTKEQKEAIKVNNESINKKYGFALLDGKWEKVVNFCIDPPSLFQPKGNHPKMGCLKGQIQPEDVTINISKEAKVPSPPPNHSWGNVIFNNTVTWLASWDDLVCGAKKYVMFGSTSSLKGKSDMKKFNMTCALHKRIKSIRCRYTAELEDKSPIVCQRATALYLIDTVALRVGNEKGNDEADTVGCCSLRYEHVTLKPPNVLAFDFLEKDSMRFIKAVSVPDQVYENISKFKEHKKEGSLLFDALTTRNLNKYLDSLLPNLSAKDFRTYNASLTFQNELDKTLDGASIKNKLAVFENANCQIAILCNHQYSTPKKIEGQMLHKDNLINTKRFIRQQYKRRIYKLDPKFKKERPELFEPEEGLTKEWCLDYVDKLVKKEHGKTVASFDKGNGIYMKLRKGSNSQSLLEKNPVDLKNQKATLIKEINLDVVEEVESFYTLDNLRKKLKNLDVQIDKAIEAKREKGEKKSFNLSMSLTYYIDPRISVAWALKHNVPIDKIFTCFLRKKHKWAMDTDKNYRL